MTDPRRHLPSTDALLRQPALLAAAEAHGQAAAAWAARSVLAEARAVIAAEAPTAEILATAASAQLAEIGEPAQRVAINATGILLHTGLGRAQLAAEAQAAVSAACGATPVQAGLDGGERVARERRVEALLRELTGCEAACVVNNNAGATLLCLAALATGREAILSRGQLVEIGGAFRMPEVMALSGARLVEVGCTNRSHLHDYAAAIGPETGALVHVHSSNYRIRGFAGTPGVAELATLAQQHGLALLDDLGSGALTDLAQWGLESEPLVRDSLAAGADLCCFSADKLIGGPQAGIVCGRAAAVAAARKHPFARMLRPCKLTLAALEATLLLWVGGRWRKHIPLYRALDRDREGLRARCTTLADKARTNGLEAEVVDSLAYIGSGSAPDSALPSTGLRLRHPELGAAALAQALRLRQLWPRLADGWTVLDLRAVEPEQDAAIAAALASLRA